MTRWSFWLPSVCAWVPYTLMCSFWPFCLLFGSPTFLLCSFAVCQQRLVVLSKGKLFRFCPCSVVEERERPCTIHDTIRRYEWYPFSCVSLSLGNFWRMESDEPIIFDRFFFSRFVCLQLQSTCQDQRIHYLIKNHHGHFREFQPSTSTSWRRCY